MDPEAVRRLKADAAAQGLSVPAYLDVDADRSGAVRESLYLAAVDGTQIAVDVWRPRHATTALPTAIRSTRYWRDAVDSPIVEHRVGVEVRLWTEAGFALVLVDARGTGASGGRWPNTTSDGERSDLAMIVDWIVNQPWSDGTVGGWGTSYEGSTTLLLASTGHPAVKAVAARFAPYDAYHHIGFPGGIPNDGFVGGWAAFNWVLDGHGDRAHGVELLPVLGSPRPVDGHEGDVAILRKEHADNWDLAAVSDQAISREDVVDGDGRPGEAASAFGRVEQLRASRVPTWLWSAWYDGGYAAAALAQLLDPERDVRVTIGPWAHGAITPQLGDPLEPAAVMDPPYADQQRLLAAFLHHHQSGYTDNPAPKALRYYTLGDGWHDADTWPPEGASTRRHYLAADGRLVDDATDGMTDYHVDFSATTGRSNRWWLAAPVDYGDRRDEDTKLAVWDGAQLDEPLEITGNAVATLRVASTARDGAFIVYLEMVAPDGTVTYLTEATLRGIHRRLGEGEPPYATFGPWHTYSASDMEDLPVGQLVDLVVTFWPISVRIPAGHRIRIALAGADADSFRRIPAEGDVQLSISAGSWVDLPIRIPSSGRAG